MFAQLTKAAPTKMHNTQCSAGLLFMLINIDSRDVIGIEIAQHIYNVLCIGISNPYSAIHLPSDVVHDYLIWYVVEVCPTVKRPIYGPCM